jgi:hypothetical protein
MVDGIGPVSGLVGGIDDLSIVWSTRAVYERLGGDAGKSALRISYAFSAFSCIDGDLGN